MTLPEHGMGVDETLAALAALKADDLRWHEGRAFSLVYVAGEEPHRLLEGAAAMFVGENGLNVEAFPSLRRMQSDILGIVAGLLGGGAGFLTSGGTESLLMAVQVARDEGRSRGVERPNMVLPTSAHAAFAKGSHYFGVESRRVDVGDDWRADVDAMADAVDENTVLVVGSAPSYPQGVVDPIPELAAIASERGILCHVDGCMGGLILPFLAELGHPIPPWDFSVPGVTSISADLHKYGYAAKGISTITYRDKDLRRRQAFVFDGWLGGMYGSPAMQGTRPAGPMAGAWAMLHHLGREGYLRLAADAWSAARALEDAVRSHPELRVLGDPDATLFAFTGADGFDISALGDALSRKGGWYFDRQSPPPSLHATVNAVHASVIDEVVADLAACVAEVGAGGGAPGRDVAYGTVE